MPNFLQQYRTPNFFSSSPGSQQAPSSPYSGLFQPSGGQMPSAPYRDMFQPKPPEPMQQSMQQPMQQPPMQQQQPNPYMGLMNQETPALDKYNTHLSSMPNREDNQLSLIGKILSGVAGGAAGIQGGASAGFNTTQGLLDSKYNRAMQDYDMSGQNLGLMAEIEGSNLDRQGQLAVDMSDMRREDSKEDRAWENLARQQRMTEAQIENLKSIMANRGRVEYEDVNTGETKQLFADGTERIIGQTGQSLDDIAAGEASDRANRLSDNKNLIDYRAGVRAREGAGS